jgi:hypothetical protein
VAGRIVLAIIKTASNIGLIFITFDELKPSNPSD